VAAELLLSSSSFFATSSVTGTMNKSALVPFLLVYIKHLTPLYPTHSF
jgi:hypothetical protein